MIAKTDKHQYYFEVQLHWQEGRKGVLTAHDVKDFIKVATPPEFAGGIPDMWSPEHLFLSSISSCFMSTYLAIAEKRRLDLKHLECNIIGQVAMIENVLQFRTINLFPKIYVTREEDMVAANEVMIKAFKDCIIANSIKPAIIHHGQILLDKHITHHH